MKRSIRILIALLLLLTLVGFGMFVVFADQQLQQSVDRQKNSDTVTLRGDVICLPHKGDGPHTLECAIGLKAESGGYYALRDSDYYETNTRVEVSGQLIPAGESQYQIKGVIEQAKVKKLE